MDAPFGTSSFFVGAVLQLEWRSPSLPSRSLEFLILVASIVRISNNKKPICGMGGMTGSVILVLEQLIMLYNMLPNGL